MLVLFTTPRPAHRPGVGEPFSDSPRHSSRLLNVNRLLPISPRPAFSQVHSVTRKTEGAFLVPKVYNRVYQREIRYRTKADRIWSTIAFILAGIAGLAALISTANYGFDFVSAVLLGSFFSALLGAAVVNMLESIVAELRRME